MKGFSSIYSLFCLFLVLCPETEAYAKNLYFSSSTGDDTRSLEQAQDMATPWNSVDKLNSSMDLILPGDSILFRRGDIFPGQIILEKSGLPGAPIAFGAYGTGDAPVIMGNVILDSWEPYQGDIWVADCPEPVTTVNNFLINGHSQQLGRYPNPRDSHAGYILIDSHVGHSGLSSSLLGASPNWTGAEAVVRTDRWTLDRVIVQSHEGGSLIFVTETENEIRDNYGFFIQRHIQTLDRQGEWYHDEGDRKIYVYSGIDPKTMVTSVTAYPSVFTASNRSYFSVSGLEFQGSYGTNMRLSGVKNAKITDNIICESGQNGVSFVGCDDLIFCNNAILNTNDLALYFDRCHRAVVCNNQIRRVGCRAGMGHNYSGVAVSRSVVGLLFENNQIDSIGYTAMGYRGDSIWIRNNWITHFCMTIDDGAGLYTDGDGVTIEHERTLENNILMYGVGAGEGTDEPDYLAVEGIYTDDRSNNVNIINNTVTNCNKGIFVHNANHIIVKGNTLFNNETQIYFGHDYRFPGFPITNCLVEDNIFFAKHKSQLTAMFVTLYDGIPDLGFIDNNYYCRPLDDDASIYIRYDAGSGTVSRNVSLSAWQSMFGHDLHSHTSPFSIPAFELTGYGSDNMIENGSFDYDTQGWSHWSTYDNGYALWDQKAEMDGGSLNMGFNGSSGHSDGTLQCQVRFNGPEAGKNYILKFSNMTDLPGYTLRASMLRNTAPFTFITSHQYVTMAPERREFELLFTPDATEDRTRVTFDISEESGQVWLDNVALYQADVNITKIDDYIRFLVNPGSDPKPVTSPANSYDPRGNQLEISFSIGPYASVILMNSDKPYVHVDMPPADPFQIFPNPVRNILHLRIPGQPLLKRVIMDVSGRVVYRDGGGPDPTSLDVSHLPEGLYILQLTGPANYYATRFIKQ